MKQQGKVFGPSLTLDVTQRMRLLGAPFLSSPSFFLPLPSFVHSTTVLFIPYYPNQPNNNRTLTVTLTLTNKHV